MIGVTATFDGDELATSLLEILNHRELSPERIGVATSDDGEVGITVQTDEADYQEMAELMREQGAATVEVDMTGRYELSWSADIDRRCVSSSQRPSLNDAATG